MKTVERPTEQQLKEYAEKRKRMSPTQVLGEAEVRNTPVSRDTIREWFKRDLRGIHVLLAEILATDVAIDALVEVFYDRHMKYLRDQEEAAALKEEKENE